MSKEIDNKISYVFKNMLQIILNSSNSIEMVAKSINGYLFYSIPQAGKVELEFSDGETKIIRPTSNLGVDKILELLEKDKSIKISFYIGNEKIVQLNRYQVCRFEIVVFEEK